jgi:pilus assembly protein CpaE
MKQTALIAANAAGPQDVVSAVLARFDFARATNVTSRGDALVRMREEHFDLVILPLQDIQPVELLSLEREIRRSTRTAVIGTAPTSDPDLIVRAMRAGMHEFLVFPPSADDLSGAVERLMRRTRAESSEGELIAVYTAKGGLGCTTVAVNLAHAFTTTRADSRVALADLVVTGGDVRVFLNLRSSYDLGHLVDKGEKVDAELLTSLMSACHGVWVLPTGENPELDELFDAQAIAAILTHLRSHFGLTIIDCEHHLSERTLTALDAANRILIVTQLDVPSLRSTQRTLAVCRRLGYDDSKLNVVVNRYQSSDVLPLKDAEDLLQCSITWKLPNDYRLAAAALTKGVPLAVVEPASKLARSYAELAKKLTGVSTSRPGMSRPGVDAGAGARLRRLLGMNRRVANVS